MTKWMTQNGEHLHASLLRNRRAWMSRDGRSSPWALPHTLSLHLIHPEPQWPTSRWVKSGSTCPHPRSHLLLSLPGLLWLLRIVKITWTSPMHGLGPQGKPALWGQGLVDKFSAETGNSAALTTHLIRNPRRTDPPVATVETNSRTHPCVCFNLLSDLPYPRLLLARITSHNQLPSISWAWMSIPQAKTEVSLSSLALRGWLSSHLLFLLFASWFPVVPRDHR